MANDPGTHATAIVARLTARPSLLALLGRDSTHTGIYWDEVTPPVKYPAVVLAHIRTGVATCLGPGRAGLESLWLISAITTGRSYAPVWTIQTEIDAALQTAYGTAQAGAITAMQKTDMTTDSDTDEAGVAYRRALSRWQAVGPP